LYGYPGTMPGQDRYHHYLWGMEGSFEIDYNSDIINHYIDTSSGQSGSALYFEWMEIIIYLEFMLDEPTQ
jgi:hypothetical protein